MGEHIIDGKFQSDKYPWCKPGFVPLKLTDEGAWKPLWDYAQQRRAMDPEFSADLETVLLAKGFKPENAPEGPFHAKPSDVQGDSRWMVIYQDEKVGCIYVTEGECKDIRDVLNRHNTRKGD